MSIPSQVARAARSAQKEESTDYLINIHSEFLYKLISAPIISKGN